MYIDKKESEYELRMRLKKERQLEREYKKRQIKVTSYSDFMEKYEDFDPVINIHAKQIIIHKPMEVKYFSIFLNDCHILGYEGICDSYRRLTNRKVCDRRY